MQLALRILAVVLSGSVLSWIGRPALASRVSSCRPCLRLGAQPLTIALSLLVQAFALYASVVLEPTQARQRELQKHIRASKTELRATSRQEQFTEWSRLRKQVDKDLVNLETTSERQLNGCLCAS